MPNGRKTVICDVWPVIGAFGQVNKYPGSCRAWFAGKVWGMTDNSLMMEINVCEEVHLTITHIQIDCA